MKTLPLLLSFFISFNIWAQINSGGHPDGDGTPKDMTSLEFAAMSGQYSNLLVQSTKQGNLCFKGSKLNFNSLQEVYLQLVWRDPKTTAPNQNCPPDSEKNLSCFFGDKDFRNDLKMFFHSKHAKSFLKFREGDESATKEFIDYFKNKSSIRD